jgi:hypothetical protein
MPDDETFILEGTRIDGIPSFYDELSRVFMPHEEWTLGASLDALDDLLYGGIGTLVGAAHPTVVLCDSVRVRDVLGVAATREYYQDKVARPDLFDVERFSAALAALDAGGGRTYFDLVCEVFAAHAHIRFVLA